MCECNSGIPCNDYVPVRFPGVGISDLLIEVGGIGLAAPVSVAIATSTSSPLPIFAAGERQGSFALYAEMRNNAPIVMTFQVGMSNVNVTAVPIDDFDQPAIRAFGGRPKPTK